MKKEVTKEEVKKAVMKMTANKKLVRAYLRGEVSYEELKKNGITLAAPL